MHHAWNARHANARHLHSLGSAGRAAFCPQLGTADHLGGFNKLVCLRGLLLSTHCDQLEGTVAPGISRKVFRFASFQGDKCDLKKKHKKPSDFLSASQGDSPGLRKDYRTSTVLKCWQSKNGLQGERLALAEEPLFGSKWSHSSAILITEKEGNQKVQTIILGLAEGRMKKEKPAVSES